MEELLSDRKEDKQNEMHQCFDGPGGDGLHYSSTNNEKEATDTVRDSVMLKVQELMSDLEAKRKADERMLEEFRSRLQLMVDQMCEQLEKRLLERHHTTNEEVQVKLQYLNEIVDKVSNLESDINNFKSAVGNLFKDVHQCSEENQFS